MLGWRIWTGIKGGAEMCYYETVVQVPMSSLLTKSDAMYWFRLGKTFKKKEIPNQHFPCFMILGAGLQGHGE